MFPLSTIEDVLNAEKTPLESRGIEASAYALLQKSADSYEVNPALIMLGDAGKPHKTREISYRRLFSAVTQYANLFRSLDIADDSVISYLLPNTPETHFVIWGGQTAGIVNPINPYLEAPAIASIMTTANTKVLVCHGPSMDADQWKKTVEAVKRCSCIETILTLEASPTTSAPIVKGKTVLNLVAAVAGRSNKALSFEMNEDKDKVSVYFCTGGTTGIPKLAQLTSFNLTYVSWTLTHMLGGKLNDVYFCGLPLFHINAVLATGLIPFRSGGCVVLLTAGGFRNPNVIKNFWSLAAQFKPYTFSGVPTVYTALLQTLPENFDVSYLKYGLCGAAPFAAAAKKQFEDTTNIKIVEGYGMTEGTGVSSLNMSCDPSLFTSVGCRILYQDVLIGTFDDDGTCLKESAPGEAGVMAIKGPNVFKGYVSDKDNIGQFTPDGWFITGDLATLDRKDFLQLNGRNKDVIIRGGHNIDPQVIEEALSKHEAIQLVAAVGAPDQYAGELPVAYVQLKQGVDLSPSDIIDYAKKMIPERAAIPVEVRVLSQIPTTAVGKIFKPRLRELAAEATAIAMLENIHVKAAVSAEADKAYAHGLQLIVIADSINYGEVKQALSALPVSLEVKMQG